MKENEIEIWHSEYNLRQFIDMALRYSIEGVFNSRIEGKNFSIFDFYVKNARNEFELFRSQLNKKLNETQFWKAIEIDIKDRFLPMINGYLIWYEQNKSEFEKFQPLCPYSLMFSIIESTKAEILKYFPENLPAEKNQLVQQSGNANKSKLDFTKDKLKQYVLELANLDGYEKPSTYLDDLLNDIKCFNDSEFEADFFLKIHYLCMENADKFWNEEHRNDITNWLNKAPIITEVFKTTWDKLSFQETETKAEQPKFENNFDNIPTDEIYKHFKAGLVEKGYLTEQELIEYLKAAFELKTKPAILFKLKHTPTKQKIYTVFYIYYKDISQKKHEKQKEYAALLGDYFEGYKTKIIQTNWARDYKTKR